jgi:hypothetical protein
MRYISQDQLKYLRTYSVMVPTPVTRYSQWKDDAGFTTEFIYNNAWLQSVALSSSTAKIPLNAYYSTIYRTIPATDSCPVLSDGNERRPQSQVPDNTSSPHIWKLIKKWLDQCSRLHGDSCLRDDANWAPTRLLAISSFNDSASIQLQITSPTEAYSYVTLSHRWGASDRAQLKLTTNNMDTLREGISLSDLPQTFQDAIEIANQLGVSYLWIDRLCIIQDDSEDWRREAAAMGKVYKNSLLTINAAVGDGDNVGCFLRRDPARVALIPTKVPSSKSRSSSPAWAVIRADFWRFNVDWAPTNQRGWVLQERILSPRVVYFSTEQVLWECRQLRACESFPEGVEPFFCGSHPGRIVQDKAEVMLKDLLPGKQLNYYGARSHLMKLGYWSGIVKAYSGCALTFKSDKLIALSGIAREVHNMLRTDYLAGLWANQLPYTLLWWPATSGPARYASQEYVAPSWSWASLDKPVNFWPHEDESYDWEANICTTIMEYGIDLANPEDPFGQVTDGFLRVRGKLGVVTWTGTGETEDIDVRASVTNVVPFRSYETNQHTKQVTSIHENCKWDVKSFISLDDDESGPSTGYFLPIQNDPEMWAFRALLLSRLPCGRFMRVGCIDLPGFPDHERKQEIYDALPEYEITII